MTFLRVARECKDLFIYSNAYWIRKNENAPVASTSSKKQFIIHHRNNAITRNFLNCYLTIIRVNHVCLSFCPPERCFIIHYWLCYVIVESQKCPLWLSIRTHQSQRQPGCQLNFCQKTNKAFSYTQTTHLPSD